MNIKKSIVTGKCNLHVEIHSTDVRTHSMIEDHPEFKELIEDALEELRNQIIAYEVGFYRNANSKENH